MLSHFNTTSSLKYLHNAAIEIIIRMIHIEKGKQGVTIEEF